MPWHPARGLSKKGDFHETSLSSRPAVHRPDPQPVRPPRLRPGAEDTRILLETYYVDEIPEEILNLDSTEAILEALDDPYTVYMSAEEYQAS